MSQGENQKENDMLSYTVVGLNRHFYSKREKWENSKGGKHIPAILNTSAPDPVAGDVMLGC